MRSTSELTQMHSSPTQRRAFVRRLPAVEHFEHHAAQDLAVAGVSSHGKERDRLGAGAVAREQELGELGRKRSRRPGVGPVVGIGFVAAVGGVRYGAARGDEQALELVPLRHGVDAGADAPDLHDLVDDRPVAEPFDENRIGLARSKRGDAPPAFRAPRGSRHGDAPHRFAARQRLADEQVDMRLQEAARAELEDRELGQISLRAGPLLGCGGGACPFRRMRRVDFFGYL